MKKIVAILLILLVGCSTISQPTPVKEPTRIMYTIKQNQHFEEGVIIDFNALITGDYQTITIATPELTVGQHHVKVTMKKEETIEVATIQYFIDKKEVAVVEKPPITEPEPTTPQPTTPKPTTPKPEILYHYENSQVAQMRSDNLTLVNKEHRLLPDYVPPNLVAVPKSIATNANQRINAEFLEQFLLLRADAAQLNLTINLHSCYRSYDTQMAIYKRYLKNDPQSKVDTYSARPGHSEHQLGLACDFAATFRTLGGFTGTKEAKWMEDNGHNYGFILRYPKDKTNITGYMYESWHFRYLGVETATKVYNSGLTYEEWYQQNLQ